MYKTTPKPLNNLALKFTYLMVFLCLVGCRNFTSEDEANQIDKILTYKESKPITSAQNKRLDSIRRLIGNKDISRLSKFYKIKYFYYWGLHRNAAHVYVDSALNLFKDEDIIKKNKVVYFEALLLKADRLYLDGKYNQAVSYFLEAQSFRQKNLDICHDRYFTARIANVYFIQSMFQKAASYFKQSYELEKKCENSTDPLKKFFDIQALLNNTGFSYERMNMLDSAAYFYAKDLVYIDSSRSSKKIETYALNDAAAVAYDNLGSIYLKKGDLIKAEKLLTESITIKYSGGEGVKTPPLIKLATLYTLKKNYTAAQKMFDEAELLMKRFPNVEFESRWNKEKSRFYYQQGKLAAAYNMQQRYFLLKDSLEKDNTKVASINVDKDFANLAQKYNLQDLKKKDSTKNIYLVFASFLLVMIIIIVFLLLRIVNQSRKNLKISKYQNQELQETLFKLENANQNYARVMKVMAHDLKNPLSGIVGFSTLLLEEEYERKKEKESLEIIKTSADNALGMINEILNSSLFATGKTYMKRENIDIQLILQQCVSLLNFKAGEKKQKLIITSNKVLIVHANKEKLWQVFNNLLVNAIKFSPEETEIKISIQDASRYVIISITDHGIGIPPEVAPKIYDIFTEAKRLGTMGEKAYGLGLSISKQIVEAHSGNIWFENNPQGGTVFYIRLPK